MTALPAFAQDAAERVVQEGLGNPFGMTRAEWRKARPQAAWIEFLGEQGHDTSVPPQYRWPGGHWCAIADDENGSIRRQAVFYAIRAAEPLDCRLEQLTYSIRTSPDVSSSELYGELVAALSNRIGDGLPSRPDWEEVRREAARGPFNERRRFMRWYGETFTALLFESTASVGLEIRHHELTRALETPSILSPELIDATFQDKLLTQVRQVYPEIAELMLLERAATHDEIRIAAAVKTLLDARDRATSSNERAWLSLAADQVLSRLAITGEPPPERRPGLAALKPFGVTFRYDEHAGEWHYLRGLLDEIIRHYPFNDWAQMALVHKIAHGWDLVACENSYAATIQHGTEWLGRNPSSPYRLVVTQAVAQAYETWWSLSKAPEYDFLAHHSRDEATRGAAKARLEAITWYRRVLELMPAGLPIKEIERAIIHLSVDIDTGQRRYHCAVP